jgi:hypothetical protein
VTPEDDERAIVELQLAALRGAGAFQKKVAALVREAMNRAAAMVMFDKPTSLAVPAAERAVAEAADYIVVGDRPKSDRARRAAHAAALQVLSEHGLIPPKMADYVADVFDKLNAGAAEGYARPAPSKARKGGVWRDNFAVAVADETNHVIGLHGVSRERALAIVSGVKRPTAEGDAPPRAAIPLPLSEAAPRSGVIPSWPWKQAQRLLDRGEEILGDFSIRYARAQGVAARNGDQVDEAYAAAREGRLKLLASPEAAAWLYGRAGLRTGRRPKAKRAGAQGP